MTRLGALLLVVVVLLVLGHINTVRLVEQNRFETLMLSVAGQQRTLAERYVRQINLGIVGLSTGDTELLIRERAAAHPTGQRFREYLGAMIHGGPVKVGQDVQMLPAADDPSVVAKLQACQHIWDGLERSAVQALRSDNHSLVGNPAVENIQLASRQTVDAMDDLVMLLQQMSQHRLERLLLFQKGFLFTGIGLVCAILVFVYFRIVRPLDGAVQHLRLSERRYDLVLRGSSAGVWDYDLAANRVYVSRRFKDLLGYSESQEIEENGTVLTAHLHPEDSERVCQEMQDHLTLRKPYQSEHRMKTASGEYRWFSVCGQAIWDEQGKPIRFAGSISDVTAQKIAEHDLREHAMALQGANKELAQAKVRADEATQSKSEFLANMSHEIRTPMTAILGFTELLLDPEQPEESRNTNVKTILRNGQHLLGLINDILDLSKVEAGHMEADKAPCSAWKIVADVAALLRVRAIAKGIELHVYYEFPLPEMIETDALRLRQILMNLAGNAIKFTDKGEVRIVVRSQGIDATIPYLEFEILDSGVGMNEEQMSRLFTPFSQVDSSSTRRFGGTGLGLAISKRLANMLGGDVTVTSALGKGSSFRLRLPVGDLKDVTLIHGVHEAVADGPEESNAKPAVAMSGRILLVEDGPDNQRLIAFVLRKAGLNVEIADNGQIAVDAAVAAAAQGRPFELVLMDMQMPVMDGYEATAELRRQGFNTPIVALTAHAMASDREKCLRAGCDDYATKPIDRPVLLDTVRKHLSRENRAAA